MSRTVFRNLCLATLLCSAQASLAAENTPPTSKSKAASAWSEEGLVKQSIKGLDAVYSRPGANLAVYKKVRLGPISVAFRRHWEHQVAAAGGGARIRPEESQRIKDRLAKLVHEEMVKQLQAGGYALASAPADDVLDVNLSVVDLYVTAPDVLTVGRVQVFAVSAGEMTLVAELRDSATGDIVSRVYDHANARESTRPERITNVDNEVEARRAAAAWAKALRQQLDLAKASTGAKP